MKTLRRSFEGAQRDSEGISNAFLYKMFVFEGGFKGLQKTFLKSWTRNLVKVEAPEYDGQAHEMEHPWGLTGPYKTLHSYRVHGQCGHGISRCNLREFRKPGGRARNKDWRPREGLDCQGVLPYYANPPGRRGFPQFV